jgi:hypothetical protein
MKEQSNFFVVAFTEIGRHDGADSTSTHETHISSERAPHDPVEAEAFRFHAD